MIKNFLQNVGLNDKEIKVYLELLRVENDSVLDLSKKTKILRTSIYPILDSLKSKGLIVEVKVGAKIRFQAEAPEKIETYIETQKIKLDEQAQLANEYIPQLKSMSRQTGEKPIVKVYEGREGIFKANEESFGYGNISDDDTAYYIYPFDLLENLFSNEELKKGTKQRTARKIKSETLYTYSKGERTPSENSKRIKINEKKYPLTCDISIHKDKVRINTLGKSLSSLVIKSQDIADTLKSLFKIAFDNYKD
ncbi:MAG: helix-turn-helix domain-containing protein [Candidatus Falkowbacteria bacterium]